MLCRLWVVYLSITEIIDFNDFNENGRLLTNSDNNFCYTVILIAYEHMSLFNDFVHYTKIQTSSGLLQHAFMLCIQPTLRVGSKN